MRRIEIEPINNPALECFDNCAACFIKIFERTTLPNGWARSKRIFFISINFILLFLIHAADWIFFSYLPNLKILLTRHDLNSDQNETAMIVDTRNELKREQEIFDIIRYAYLACIIISAVLFLCLQCFIYLFAAWRKAWRQTLVLIVEMLALIIQICAPPILISILLIITSIGTNGDKLKERPTIKNLCEWQILVLASTHATVLLLWEVFKLIQLGLCCCCCCTCCFGIWPIYKTCTRKSDDSESFRKSHRRRSSVQERTLVSEILAFLPPESDRGSWFTATKWCVFTAWTFPITLAGLTSCAVLIAIVILNRNFVYYRLWI